MGSHGPGACQKPGPALRFLDDPKDKRRGCRMAPPCTFKSTFRCVQKYPGPPLPSEGSAIAPRLSQASAGTQAAGKKWAVPGLQPPSPRKLLPHLRQHAFHTRLTFTTGGHWSGGSSKSCYEGRPCVGVWAGGQLLSSSGARLQPPFPGSRLQSPWPGPPQGTALKQPSAQWGIPLPMALLGPRSLQGGHSGPCAEDGPLPIAGLV